MTEPAHNRPRSARETPLYDLEISTPSHAERARTLAASVKTGTLSTLAKEPAGHPYGSFVTVAFDGPDPVFLISDLAEHTRNLRADPRASLLIAEATEGNPLAAGRITLLGHGAVSDESSAREAYLANHPDASYYADFKDFRFWKLAVEGVRYIGGFGRMSWVETEAWRDATPDPLAASASRIVDHMNDDHADALVAYCHAFSRATEASDVVMTGIDRYGIEMSVMTEKGRRPVRVAFPAPVDSADAARRALIALVEDARARIG